MATRINCLKPVMGMIVALRNTASETFGDIPARVINIWPPFKSGDCLLTLEYAQPVKINNQLITHTATACLATARSWKSDKSHANE